MSGAGQGDDRNSMALLWLVGFIFVVGIVVWLLFSGELKYAFIQVRKGELYLISFILKFLPGFSMVQEWRHEVERTLQVTKIMTPEMLSMNYAGQLSTVVGTYLQVPITLVLAWFSYVMYERNVKMRYRKRYDMNSLARQECSIWPQINPVLGAGIEAAEINKGAWAMAQSPLEFCRHFNLLTIQVELPQTALAKGPKFSMVLDKMRAGQVFSSQLGKLWAGADRLPIHRRALLATFLARGCRDTQSARNLLAQINRSCAHGKLDKMDFAGADALWKKHINNRQIKDIINVHAYESTVLVALLLYAREDGVFAAADFLWLKPFDRRLWYVLNNVGRQTAFCEAAGVHAHFLAERALNRALRTPMINEAVKGLQLALDDIIYVPTTEERDELLKQVKTED